MVTGLTDTGVLGVDVAGARRSTVPRNVAMVLPTARTDAGCAAVLVSLQPECF